MLRLNDLRDNAGLGIDLGPAGVTPNDPVDATVERTICRMRLC
jgi:hypothetical protein